MEVYIGEIYAKVSHNFIFPLKSENPFSGLTRNSSVRRSVLVGACNVPNRISEKNEIHTLSHATNPSVGGKKVLCLNCVEKSYFILHSSLLKYA